VRERDIKDACLGGNLLIHVLLDHLQLSTEVLLWAFLASSLSNLLELVVVLNLLSQCCLAHATHNLFSYLRDLLQSWLDAVTRK